MRLSFLHIPAAQDIKSPVFQALVVVSPFSNNNKDSTAILYCLVGSVPVLTLAVIGFQVG